MPANAYRMSHLRQHLDGRMPWLPRRVQVVRGIVPAGAVYVGRPVARHPHLNPTHWGNPYRMRSEADRDRVCDLYAALFDVADPELGDVAAALRERAVAELAGRALACWCRPGQRCHADVLLAVANPRPGLAREVRRPRLHPPDQAPLWDIRRAA